MIRLNLRESQSTGAIPAPTKTRLWRTRTVFLPFLKRLGLVRSPVGSEHTPPHPVHGRLTDSSPGRDLFIGKPLGHVLHQPILAGSERPARKTMTAGTSSAGLLLRSLRLRPHKRE